MRRERRDRRAGGWRRAACALASVTLLGGCGLGRLGDPVEIDGIEMRNYAVELEKGSFEVRYARAGDDSLPRAIFVHGTPGSLGAWTDYLTEPLDGVETIAMDRPGFGGTTPLRTVRSFEDQARALEPLLVERDGVWPVLIGHSLGAPIIARLAADHPDRVGGLVILSGSLDPSLEHPKWYNRAGSLPLVDLLLPKTLRHSNEEVMAARRETRELEPLLGRITCPVVIVHGTEDSLVPYENVEYMRRTLTGSAHLVVVPLEGEDHFIPWTQEWLIRRVVERLVREISGGSLMEVDLRAALVGDGASGQF